MIRFDHIAIGCPTLDAGRAYVKAATGLDVPVGGQHPNMGTHNRVMATGPDTFFEIIAIDPEAPAPPRPRWFGLDDDTVQTRLAQSCRPHAWVLHSDDLARDLDIARGLGIDLGQPTRQTRGDLHWLFAVRDDGAIPLSGGAPMLMQWPATGAHPAVRMPDLGARIRAIGLTSPCAGRIDALLTALGADMPDLTLAEGAETRLSVTLDLGDREVVLR
jgi:hypothetical protein